MAHTTARSVDDALDALADGARVLAGGTDFFPGLGDRPADFPIVDVTRADGLRGVTRAGTGWRIGAATTWTDLIRAPLPPAFDGLKAAAREVGSVQIQNTATLAGNLCNASPAADGVPCLLALDATVEIASRSGRRSVPLSAFITGVRRTALESGELLTAIHIPPLPDGAQSAFLKLGSRRYLVISIAMGSAVIVPSGAEGCCGDGNGAGTVAEARIALGACSAVAQRLTALEDALVGTPLDRMADVVDPAHIAPLSPIDDVRGTARYRRDAAVTMLRRILTGFTT